MANVVLPIPPTGTPLLDQNYQVSEPWKRYFLSLQNLGGTFAPVDAQYYVATSNATLTNERNLGVLASGYLKITVAAGVATPSSTSRIPLVDGGTNANLNATGGTHQVLMQETAGANVTVRQLTTADISGSVTTTSGTYTPTLTSVANVSASTPYQCQYMQVGNTVTVSGKMDIDPTSATTLTRIGISLPVASNIGSSENCGGTGVAPVPSYAAAILGDSVNDRAELDYTTASDVGNNSFWFTFTYTVI